jgi:rRNA maturation endonuclease Nob1
MKIHTKLLQCVNCSAVFETPAELSKKKCDFCGEKLKEKRKRINKDGDA